MIQQANDFAERTITIERNRTASRSRPVTLPREGQRKNQNNGEYASPRKGVYFQQSACNGSGNFSRLNSGDYTLSLARPYLMNKSSDVKGFLKLWTEMPSENTAARNSRPKGILDKLMHAFRIDDE